MAELSNWDLNNRKSMKTITNISSVDLTLIYMGQEMYF